MKKFFGTIVALLSAVVLSGQMPANENISWRYSVEPLQGDTCAITLTATIAPGWHIYDFGPYTGGPNALEILFAPKAGAELVGDTEAQQELAAGAQITSIPTVMGFRDGILLFSQPGVLPAAGLESLISQLKELDMDDVRAKLAAAESEMTGDAPQG